MFPTWSTLHKLTRHFPYTEMLAVFMPVIATVWIGGRADLPTSLGHLLPFIAAFAAGFIYNDLTDTRDPDYKRNPLIRGETDVKAVRNLLLLALALAVVAFVVFYRSWIAFVLFMVYLVLCLAYSGLRLRFKETYLGPAVASFIIWVGGPLILAVEYGVLSWGLWTFVFGVWLIYAAREIHHMVSDYDCDRQSGYQTFAVRVGVPRARWAENAVFVAGSILLAIALWGLLNPHATLSWIMLALNTVLILAASLHLSGNPLNNVRETRSGYWLVRFFFVALAVAILQLSPVGAALTLWAFATSHRS